jgi:hypothetical protein
MNADRTVSNKETHRERVERLRRNELCLRLLQISEEAKGSSGRVR